MTMTTTLSDAHEGGTDVVVMHDRIPDGVPGDLRSPKPATCSVGALQTPLPDPAAAWQRPVR
ncbi:hypothetical protein [uncultured Mycobacterium sp.]|uniref:hypothetical protein n=1 Tax=uncultured Mycobacterium sp. TaxID=171292 RepID=UPI0035CBD20F